MKVSGPSSVVSSAASKGARPAAAGGGFSVGGASPVASAARSAPAGPVASLDALIALQAVGGPLERRRRAMGRANRILDVLDEVKISLLEGHLSPAALDRLGRAVRDQREATDDPGLESVLDEIETRAAVEMAKLEMARAAA